MINLTCLCLGSETTLYLKDRVIYGRYESASWGVITMTDNIVAYTDGDLIENTDVEQINIADVVAVGNTGTRRHRRRNELCWQLDILDYEINFENKFRRFR